MRKEGREGVQPGNRGKKELGGGGSKRGVNDSGTKLSPISDIFLPHVPMVGVTAPDREEGKGAGKAKQGVRFEWVDGRR